MPKRRVQLGRYKTVFRGIIFEVQHAKATFPSGVVKTFERVVRPPSVTILALDRHGRLLLTREYRRIGRRYEWRLPAGRVNRGEDPRRAAQRELREETGFRAVRLKLFHLATGGGSWEWKKYAYLATGLVPSPLNGDEDEDITVVPTTISRAFQMVLRGEIDNDGIALLILKLHRLRKR